MSIFNTVLLQTGDPLQDVAARLQQILGLRRSVDDAGRIFLYREKPSQSVHDVGGEISASIYRSVPDVPEDDSVLDGYVYAWDVDTDPRDENLLSVTTRALFRDLAASLEWPSVLVHNHVVLLAASSPETGLVEFDPGIGTDADARDQWRAFDVAER